MDAALARRHFLKSGSLAAAAAALSACKVGALTGAARTPAAAATSPAPAANADEALLIHALRRITFGPTPAEFERARQIGLEACIDEQLHPEAIDDSGLEARLAPLTTLTMTPEQRAELDARALPAQELILATVLRQVYSRRQLFEVLVDFWSNHFNIYLFKNADRFLKTDDDRDVIRAHALGKFADLLSASAHSPAMLVYLDQAESTKQAPNENYARELMELHTISVEGGYTQHDVEDVARCFTGWSIAGRRQPQPFTFVFRPRLHDDGEKRVLDLRLPAGGGVEDGEKVLAMLAEHPMTARFIARKLARRLVADEPPAPLVDRAAGVFAETGGDLRQVTRAILFSDEFRASGGQKIKRPLEFFVSALRALEAEVEFPRPAGEWLRLLGQLPFAWPTPDGYPDYAAAWLNTSGLLNRWNFALALTSNRVRGIRVDVFKLAGGARAAEEAVDALSLRLFGAQLPDDARGVLVAFASAGRLHENLPLLAGLMIGSPHFQIR